MSRFYFIRHGDAYDEMGIQLDSYPLNNSGRIQGLQLAKRLKDNKFDAMYCSKIKRSMQTCEIVNDVHKMEVIYNPKLNEVGGEIWPQPGFKSEPEALASYDKALHSIGSVFKKLVEDHPAQEVIIFTHGNWIRVLLSLIVSKGSHESFFHFVIHNTSLTIIDVNEDTGFESIITVSDAGHTHLYESHI